MTGLREDVINKKLQETLNLKTTLPKTSNIHTVNKSAKLYSIEKTLLPYVNRKVALEDKAYKD